jgi:hypothetical protein
MKDETIIKIGLQVNSSFLHFVVLCGLTVETVTHKKKTLFRQPDIVGL